MVGFIFTMKETRGVVLRESIYDDSVEIEEEDKKLLEDEETRDQNSMGSPGN